jgi:hypothetical protein
MLLAAGLGVAACGSDAPPPPPSRTDLPYELYCDIGNGECQHRIYDSLAAMLGAEGLERPAIRTISVEQHAEEVRNGLSLEDLTGEDATTRGLRLLGFIPKTSESLAATQAEYFINQIAAYYNRGSRRITVIDRDYEEVSAQTLLAHEFTHAIQDLQFSLNQVSAGADTEDAAMGVRSVIEGDAMHSSFAWAYEKLGYLPEEIDWDAIHEEREASSREEASDLEIALIDSASGFPYSYGFDFMTAVTLAGGLGGRAAAFASPPFTSLELMAGYGAELPTFDFPAAAHPSPVEGHSVEVENRFGAWYVYGFLRRLGMSDHAAWMTALGWLGDELGIYDNGSEVVAVWRVRFDHPLKALILREEVQADATEATWSAVLDDEDVFVFAAESGESLLAWTLQPLDSMTAAAVPKGARRRGGAVSVGNCLQSRDFSLPFPPPLLH